MYTRDKTILVGVRDRLLASRNSSNYSVGSIIVHPYGNSSLPALELGASIFVEANKNLWRASNEFNFTRKSFRDSNGGTGIWDGKEIILSVRASVQ